MLSRLYQKNALEEEAAILAMDLPSAYSAYGHVGQDCYKVCKSFSKKQNVHYLKRISLCGVEAGKIISHSLIDQHKYPTY